MEKYIYHYYYKDYYYIAIIRNTPIITIVSPANTKNKGKSTTRDRTVV